MNIRLHDVACNGDYSLISEKDRNGPITATPDRCPIFIHHLMSKFGTMLISVPTVKAMIRHRKMTQKQIEGLVESYLANSDGAVTQEAARAAVDQILFDVDVARRSGGLAEINRAYRARRLAGEAHVSYAAFLNNAIAELIVAAARGQ